MPDSVKETLRSDGTAFNVVGDADINAGALLDTNGRPAIIPSSSASLPRPWSDGEIVQLTNYVAAGGYLLVGSSAFTRHPDGTTRGDFALANEMGVHMVHTNLQNWTDNSTFSKTVDHRLVPLISPAECSPGKCRQPRTKCPGLITEPPARNGFGRSSPATPVVIAQGDAYPYLLVKPYGKGCFIYVAAMQPLIGHGGHAPGMYAYGIFRQCHRMGVPVGQIAGRQT
jgi:hypothetical protein